MFQIPDMSTRFFMPEIMDDINEPQEELFRTLGQFRTVNFLFSRVRVLVKRYLLPHMTLQGNREIVCADIGAGGGDFALWFTKVCRKKGIRVKMLCIDHDPRVVRYARQKCAGHDDIVIHEASAFSVDTINGPIDYIFSNHFLHHIASEKIPGLLKKFHDSARCGFLVNDLSRSRLAYIGFTLFCQVFFRSRMSCHDGRLSIRKGFLGDEMTAMVDSANLSTPVFIGTMHPGRIFLTCLKDPPEVH
jgi:2-polyprenyl-3-methyl-5-hydroxy-6-metoxy-1,4-benzoquinol methylase